MNGPWELLPIPGFLMSCAWAMARAAGGGDGGDGVEGTHKVRSVLLRFSSVGSVLPTALPSEPKPSSLLAPGPVSHEHSRPWRMEQPTWTHRHWPTPLLLSPHPVLKSSQFALLCPSNLLASPCPTATASGQASTSPTLTLHQRIPGLTASSANAQFIFLSLHI